MPPTSLRRLWSEAESDSDTLRGAGPASNNSTQPEVSVPSGSPVSAGPTPFRRRLGVLLQTEDVVVVLQEIKVMISGLVVRGERALLRQKCPNEIKDRRFRHRN